MICKTCAVWADGDWSHDWADCEEAGCTCQHKPKGAWRGEKHLGAEGR